MSGVLIDLEAVEFGYAGHDRVLCGVDLQVSAGERLGLVGSNGCGKTTLLGMMVGLVKPSGGIIRAFGEERREEKDFHEVRKRVGLVFQHADDQLFCPTVIEDVMFGLLNLGKGVVAAREMALESLELFGLDGLADRVTYQLSGGEKRLVSLACVLAMGPEVLLLDEPTGGLDDKSRDMLVGVLGELHQAMVMVSHEQGFVEGLAGRVLKLEGGKLVSA